MHLSIVSVIKSAWENGRGFKEASGPRISTNRNMFAYICVELPYIIIGWNEWKDFDVPGSAVIIHQNIRIPSRRGATFILFSGPSHMVLLATSLCSWQREGEGDHIRCDSPEIPRTSTMVGHQPPHSLQNHQHLWKDCEKIVGHQASKFPETIVGHSQDRKGKDNIRQLCIVRRSAGAKKNHVGNSFANDRKLALRCTTLDVLMIHRWFHQEKKPPDVYFQSFLESVLAVWGTTHGKSILG